MPLTEEEWETLKTIIEGVFRDAARDLDGISREAQAILRVSQRGDVPGDVGLVLEISGEGIGAGIARIERRLRLFGRDIEDLHRGLEL